MWSSVQFSFSLLEEKKRPKVVTYSGPKAKITYSDPKVTHSDPTHPLSPQITSLPPNWLNQLLIETSRWCWVATKFSVSSKQRFKSQGLLVTFKDHFSNHPLSTLCLSLCLSFKKKGNHSEKISLCNLKTLLHTVTLREPIVIPFLVTFTNQHYGDI